MSSSSFCQGLQSCLEPSLVVEPRVLRLKLAPPETTISPSADSYSGGWSFLQSLAKNQPVFKDEAYIPPNCKRGGSVLSKKSLEMCTESLGSETGSDGGESSDEVNLLSSENSYENQEIAVKSSKLRETTRMNRSVSFPPPLTYISGSSTVRMRPRREGGRLVLEAVSVSNSSQAYLKAERIDGRLRLHLMKDCNSDEEEEGEEEEEEEEGEEEGEMTETSENGGGEMGMEKLKRPSRCKEGGSGNKSSSSLLNWEPFLVAT